MEHRIGVHVRAILIGTRRIFVDSTPTDRSYSEVSDSCRLNNILLRIQIEKDPISTQGSECLTNHAFEYLNAELVTGSIGKRSSSFDTGLADMIDRVI